MRRRSVQFMATDNGTASNQGEMSRREWFYLNKNGETEQLYFAIGLITIASSVWPGYAPCQTLSVEHFLVGVTQCDTVGSRPTHKTGCGVRRSDDIGYVVLVSQVFTQSITFQ